MGMGQKIQENKEWLILLALCIAFVMFKIPDLQLPYFWDEAWSYIPAVKAMAETGPSMIPGAIPAELYRGHPLFFYFAASSWKLLAGDSIFIMKIFPLLVSLGVLWVLFDFGKRVLNKSAALFITVLLLIQSIFFTQASFVLPEIFLALLTLLCFRAYYLKNYLWTSIWLSLALLTKESAVVLAGTLGLIHIYSNIKEKKFKPLSFWFFLPPVLLTAAFFIAQEQILGWYFFPKHVSKVDFQVFLDKWSSINNYILLNEGRVLLSISALISALMVHFLRPQKRKENAIILGFALFIVLYNIFSSANFQTTRYLLSTLPMSAFIWGTLIYRLIEILPKSAVAIYAIPLMVLVFNLREWDQGDVSLGYRDVVKSHMMIAEYCEDNLPKDSEISAQFLMRYNLARPYLGYIKGPEKFRKMEQEIGGATEYLVLTSLGERQKYFRQKIQDLDAELVVRFESGGA